MNLERKIFTEKFSPKEFHFPSLFSSQSSTSPLPPSLPWALHYCNPYITKVVSLSLFHQTGLIVTHYFTWKSLKYIDTMCHLDWIHFWFNRRHFIWQVILQILEPKRPADFLYYDSLFDCMSFKYFAHQASFQKSLISENRFYMLMFQISDIKWHMAWPWVQQVAHQTGKEKNEAVRQLRQSVAILLVSDNVAMFDSSSLSVIHGNIDI